MKNKNYESPLLSWGSHTMPLMLAPMQGLTNRALRDLFISWVRPDVVFTEYVRVVAGARQVISKSDRKEITGMVDGVPLVVQLIGCDTGSLVSAAQVVQDLGVEHLNINLGCPYGRMNSGTAGGSLLGDPCALAEMLARLRPAILGSFSLKVRSGLDNPREIFGLSKIFEDNGVDYIIIHPRTVAQRYGGAADHSVTQELVRTMSVPVIANGDIFTTERGREVLAQTNAAGLMLGRGAIGDPLLFKRMRDEYPAHSVPEKREAELRFYLEELLVRYEELFCGDNQVLAKLKEVISQVKDPEFVAKGRKLKKCQKISSFRKLLADLPQCYPEEIGV